MLFLLLQRRLARELRQWNFYQEREEVQRRYTESETPAYAKLLAFAFSLRP